MAVSPKILREQLALLRPLLDSCSLKTIRKGQNKVGELMGARNRRQVIIKKHRFAEFEGAWMIPADERRQGVILYLHGGGYACGGIEYALGYGSDLCARNGTRVFCAAYRLAPEHRFPAALDDALEAYRYLLSKGYSNDHITLCGESAGGGLCYALCFRLRELGLPMPCGIIAISPWTDLTASGSSYEENRQRDPSMTMRSLRYYAGLYTDDPTDPQVSPLFGDVTGFPPSLIFVGADEIMRSDAQLMHEKLLASGCESWLRVAPNRWHGYLLYDLPEDAQDRALIETFLTEYMSPIRKLRWMRLDNAAKIYPAARRSHWSNVFRVSVTLTEEVDEKILRSALDVTVRRFPSFATRLRRGVFWYYLEEIQHPPKLREECSYPLTWMSPEEMRECAFRVLVYKSRIALEIFHSLTDGNGAMVFLKSLTAEYLQQRYGIHIPAEHGVLGRLEEPSPAEMEDSFQRYAGTVGVSRRGNEAWRMSGIPEPKGFLHVTCFRIPVDAALEKAHSYGVSLTTFLCAGIMYALQSLQAEKIPYARYRRPIKLQVPVNLRRIFPSKSLRNFALYVTPEIMPRLGQYTFEEICREVHHTMGREVTAKHMSRMISTNVSSERLMAVKLMPLFAKNLIMKLVFNSVGERMSCLSLSNLGVVELPEQMKPYVKRMDFILGVQATKPYNCGVLSYGNTLYMNFIRNTREPELEARFHQVLRDMGIPVLVESNRPE